MLHYRQRLRRKNPWRRNPAVGTCPLRVRKDGAYKICGAGLRQKHYNENQCWRCKGDLGQQRSSMLFGRSAGRELGIAARRWRRNPGAQPWAEKILELARRYELQGTGNISDSVCGLVFPTTQLARLFKEALSDRPMLDAYITKTVVEYVGGPTRVTVKRRSLRPRGRGSRGSRWGGSGGLRERRYNPFWDSVKSAMGSLGRGVKRVGGTAGRATISAGKAAGRRIAAAGRGTKKWYDEGGRDKMVSVSKKAGRLAARGTGKAVRLAGQGIGKASRLAGKKLQAIGAEEAVPAPARWRSYSRWRRNPNGRSEFRPYGEALQTGFTMGHDDYQPEDEYLSRLGGVRGLESRYWEGSRYRYNPCDVEPTNRYRYNPCECDDCDCDPCICSTSNRYRYN